MSGEIIRKDLNSLKPWEAERFWACLLYLNILPPKEINQETKNYLRNTEVYNTFYFDNKKRKSVSYRSYKPLNRYDEFISSHATVCEHMTNYFGYYHRHLLALMDLALNEADQSLRKHEIPESFNNNYYKSDFEAIFDRYDKIIEGCKKEEGSEKLPWIGIHYWVPLDYRS